MRQTKFQLLLQTAKAGHIHYHNTTKESKAKALKYIISAAARNEVFVYEFTRPKLKRSDDLLEMLQNTSDYLEETKIKVAPQVKVDIDSPFEVFSIEYEDNDQECFITLPPEDDPHKVWTECVMVEELEDDEFRYYSLLRWHDGDKIAHYVVVTEDATWWTSILKDFLDKLNNNACGVEDVNEFMSFREGKKKIPIKRDKIFIVAYKQSRRSKSYNAGKSINWSHAFNVRGHWRRIFCPECKGSGCAVCDHTGRKNGFYGKNRKGEEKVVKGKTWVSHSTRNEDKDPLKKVRKVKT